MAILAIPITNEFAAFQFKLTLEGELYTFRFRHNQRTDRYAMSISDANDSPVVMGKKILIDHDLFGRYRDVRLPPGQFLALDVSGKDQQPSRLVFGNDVQLFYRESTT